MAEVKEVIDAVDSGSVSVVAKGDGEVELRVEKGTEVYDPETGKLYEARTVKADDLRDAVNDAEAKLNARDAKARRAAAKAKG